MCYRYSIQSDATVLTSRFHTTVQEPLEKRYHVGAFDQTLLPVIASEQPTRIQLFSWGLIPPWVHTSTQAQDIRKKTVNARAETIYEKPAFRHAALNNHCLVLADGFFEWHEYLGRKFPYYIRLPSQEPFAMAGLWEPWKHPLTGELMKTYTIITTEANTMMQTIHNTKKRMPVILKKTVEPQWLTTGLTREQALPMLAPLDDGLLEAFTISKLLTTKEKNLNVPEVLQPYHYPGVRPRYEPENYISH